MSGPLVEVLTFAGCPHAEPALELVRRVVVQRGVKATVQRVDIPDKVFAHARFIHDAPLPGMLHGRVLRHDACGARLEQLREDDARALAGIVAVVRDGNFAGVVGETEGGANAALKALRKGATWASGERRDRTESRLGRWGTRRLRRSFPRPSASCSMRPFFIMMMRSHSRSTSFMLCEASKMVAR